MGLLDEPLGELAQLLVELFVDTPAVLKRVEQSYEPGSGSNVTVVTSTITTFISPPFPFDVRKVDGKNVLTQDLLCYVPAKPLQDAGFDPIPTSKITVFVETRGRTYKAHRVEIFASGDTEALYGIQLRP